MTIDNTAVQMRKGILEYCILLIISRGEIYASDLIEELKQAKIIVVEGTLYPLLSRLHNTGYLSYAWKESNAGPPRKYYQITDTGTIFLERLNQSWEELLQSIAMIKQTGTENQTSHE